MTATGCAGAGPADVPAACATATPASSSPGCSSRTIGTWLQLTAMSLLVYDLTGRSTDLGITVALQFLPMLVLGAWAGAVADRRDKRTLAIVTQRRLAAAGARARPARPRRLGQRAGRVGA